MSMTDASDDTTKNDIKKAQKRKQEGSNLNEKEIEDERETSGDAPVDNLA